MISETEAIARARDIANQRGWTWLEPVEAHQERAFLWFGAVRWVVVTNAESRGASARIVLSAEGEILQAGYLPR